jgi:cobalt-zinc-cadmium efflux system membrane fusion protein
MKRRLELKRRAVVLLLACAVVLTATVLLRAWSGLNQGNKPHADTALAPAAATPESQTVPTLELAPTQLDALKIEEIGKGFFPVEKMAVGSIDFDEDRAVQVFSPYAGKIIAPMVNLGDEVEKGQPLYTIDSPDLIQAESTLISAAATLSLTQKELARAKDLSTTQGISERELEQATSDDHAAEGAFKAARHAVLVFGKTEAEVDQLVTSRRIDPALVIRSPVTGRVTSRNAQPGLLVQPGNAPAPYSVADLSKMWMLGNVAESDSPLFQVGQPVRVTVMALPGRAFEGVIAKMGAALDTNTHRIMIRSEVADPKHELRPGMLASFVIQVSEPRESTAIPVNGVVREGDGTMTAWVTTDRRHFIQRVVRIGLQFAGRYQVLEGLEPGELVVTDGAIFLSNMLQAPPTS